MWLIEWLNTWDKEISLIVNSWNNSVLDFLMPIVSFKWTWLPLYFFLVFVLFRKRKSNKSFFIFLFLIIPIGVFVSDQLSNLFKNNVMRPRPCHYPGIMEFVHTIKDKCGGRFGFYSAHASNSFFVASMVSGYLESKNYGILLFFWAAIVAYSRIYLGVHFVGDILFGGFIGVLISKLFLLFYNNIGWINKQ